MSFPGYESYRDSGVKWLGEIPADWDVKRFRFLFRESREKIEREIVGEMLSVSGYRGIQIKEYDDENRRRSDEELSGYRIVRPGQLVVNTMWLNYAGLGVSEHEGHVSPAYRSYWISDELDRRYAHHLLRSAIYVQGYTRLLTGIRPNSLQMSREDMMDFPVLLPPKAVQVAISDFLDRETAKIDALAEEQQRLIGLLNEKKQTAISQAVTKGLNSAAAMRDSGLEWLGEIPAHWEVKKLKHLIVPGSSISYGIVQPGDPLDEGVPFVQTSNMSTGDFSIEALQKTTTEIAAAYPRSRLRGGEVILGIRASIGAAHVVPESLSGANLSRGVARIECSEIVAPNFLVAALRSSATSQYWALGKQGSTFSEVSIETVRELAIGVPPKSEQEDIVRFAEESEQKLGALARQAEMAKSLLLERRSALISAAVIGKIDVRGAGISPSRVRDVACAEIVRSSASKSTFGRVKFQKLTYLAEVHSGISEIGGTYAREAAGPLDRDLIQRLEKRLSDKGIAEVMQADGPGSQVAYKFVGDAKAVSAETVKVLGERCALLRDLIKRTADLDTKATEAVATLYAVWNDELIDGRTPTDDQIIMGVLNDWHPEKPKKFTADDLTQWLDWMRRNGIVPNGTGPKTYSPRLFA